MSELTSELNLVQAVDDDDTADYLTIGLSDSLAILDGLFNAATGHAHNGAHQGGQLQFLDLTVDEDLTVNGALLVAGSTNLQGTLTVTGQATFSGGVLGVRAADLSFGTHIHNTATVYDVAVDILMVFVTVGGATVRLPAAAGYEQKPPITISPNFSVSVSVTAASGGVYGGSFDPNTGAVMNGSIVSSATSMDSITYKSDGASWRAV